MSDDFDRKLEQLRRGTEPMRVPEDFDAVMTAKLVAAAALPPAVAGAGLALGVRLLLGVLGFSVAAGGVWWATQGVSGLGEPRVEAPTAVTAVTEQVGPGAPNAPVVQLPLPPSRSPPSSGGVVARVNGLDGGIVEASPDQEPVPAEAAPGTDASTSVVVAVAQSMPVLVATGKVMSCGRSIDRIDLVSRGSVQAARLLVGASNEPRLEAVLAKAHTPNDFSDAFAETVAVGRFVVDGGPGIKAGIAGNVHTVGGNWFVVSGGKRDRIELVVNEYRPVALSLQQLGRGDFYVGDVQLTWVGAQPADEHGLKVLVQGVPPGEQARVRLFPMVCGVRGNWEPSWVPAIDVPAGAGDTNLQHLSPTRYRVAAYAPGAAPAWVDQSVYDARVSSAVLALPHEDAVNVEYTVSANPSAAHPQIVRARLELSRGWHPLPSLNVRFVPGRQPGERCFEMPDGWVVHNVGGVALTEARPLERWDHAPLARCLNSDGVLMFESLLTHDWVLARFGR